MKILLADDEPIARTMLEHWLAGWGYEVIPVKDGEAALTALKADPEIRLAVIDWVMPKLDGVSVCRRLRQAQQEPFIYVLLLTARDNKADIVEGLDAGADDYLVKPCNPLDLKVRLRAGRRIVELSEQLVLAREALSFDATHDGLTGMLNRRAILEQLERELLRAARRGAPVAVLSGDLGHLETVSGGPGQDAGDTVLRETARRTKSCLRAHDAVGRVGGNGILCVLPEATAAIGQGVAERLVNVLGQKPMVMASGSSVQLNVRIGIASTEQSPGATAEQLVRAAEVALSRAKHAESSRTSLATTLDFGPRRVSDEASLRHLATSS